MPQAWPVGVKPRNFTGTKGKMGYFLLECADHKTFSFKPPYTNLISQGNRLPENEAKPKESLRKRWRKHYCVLWAFLVSCKTAQSPLVDLLLLACPGS